METEIDQDPKVAFAKVYQKARAMGLSDNDLMKLESLEYIRTEISKKSCGGYVASILLLCMALVFSVLLTDYPVSKQTALEKLWFGSGRYVEDERCLLDLREKIMDFFRPVTNCDICRNLNEVDRVANITPEEFEAKYAYSGRPVVITDGAKNWSAPKVFSFKYFKELYPEGSPVLRNMKENCQFFPYKTSFQNLGEVFQMSEARANLQDGQTPWYIGWSNCDPSVSAELRTHYQRPYFLPKSSEGMRTDWIFMGSPGFGAHIHVDNVNNPSWQAQIAGRKVWTLRPPLECYHECPKELKVTINAGEMTLWKLIASIPKLLRRPDPKRPKTEVQLQIVLDTNTWYHGTLVVSDDISITIGSEYD